MIREQERDREQSQHLARIQPVLAEYLQYVRQKRNAGSEQDEADNIPSALLSFSR